MPLGRGPQRPLEREVISQTLWGKEELDDFFPGQKLVDEMRNLTELHEEHREAKQKAQEDSDMENAPAGDLI